MRMNRIAALTMGAGMITMAACSDSPVEPTTPAAVKLPSTTSFAVGGVTNTPRPTAVTGKLFVCKQGNATNGTFTITRRTEGATITGSSSVGGFTGAWGVPVPNANPQSTQAVIANNTCLEVANDDSPSGNGSHLTITEQPQANTTFSIACFFRGYNLEGTVILDEVPCQGGYANGGDIFLNHFHGYVIVYTNTFTPPTGNQGCTPGYWKQDQHFGNWETGLGTTFADAGMNFGFTGTLLAGLGAGGGGVNALARHAAAAYLNSLTNSGVNYKWTTAQVQAIANGTGAYAGLSIEARKDLLAAANEGVGGCPLGRAEL